MQNPIATKPLYIRIPLIILILGSTVLILGTVFDLLPADLSAYSSLGYLGLFVCDLYMLWIIYRTKQANHKKATT